MISLDKTVPAPTPHAVHDAAVRFRVQRQSRLPRYPLYGHRDSLRRNNLIALHSALVIVALNDGTAHRGPITTV